MFVRISAAALVLAFVAGCSSTPQDTETDTEVARPVPSAASESAEEETEEAEEKERSFFVSLLLYLPNRILDLLDIARVDVGPGVGVQAQLTEVVQVKASAV